MAEEKMRQPDAASSSASSSPPPTIRVLDTALVHPSSSPEEETSLPLTFLDVLWLHAPPVQRVLFYRLAPDADTDAVLANLRRAVRAFFPLAGRLRLAPGTEDDRYELHYRPGDAVAFTVAEYVDGDHELDSLAADEPREATLLSGRRGLALGVTVHHAACDGAASTHFLHTWAAAACSSGSARPPPPVIDRTLVSDPKGRLYDVFCPPPASSTTEDMGFVNRMPDDHQCLATFTLSRAHLQRVKDVVVAVTPPRRCTSLVAALGFVWSCYQRAKPRDGARTCSSLLSVDRRSRMKPPLPDRYFGNCVGPALAVASRSELAAGAAREPSKERIVEAASMGTMLTVAGSPRFRVYDLDTGFGRPVKAARVLLLLLGATTDVAILSSAFSSTGCSRR
ncbi:hypothetical protein EJB05_29276, partial [Eragrostis curvula]